MARAVVDVLSHCESCLISQTRTPSWPTRSLDFHTPTRVSLFPPPPIPVSQLSPSDTISINSHYICLLGASRIRKHGSDRLRLLELDRNPPHNPESAWLDCTAPHYCESTRHTNAGLALLVAPSLQHYYHYSTARSPYTTPALPCDAILPYARPPVPVHLIALALLLGAPTAISPAPGLAVARPTTTTTTTPATPHSFEPGQHRPSCCALRRLWRSSSS